MELDHNKSRFVRSTAHCCTFVSLLLLEHDVAEVEHAGDDGVDGQLLRVAHAKRRHGVVGELEVFDVIKLNVAQTAALQELDERARCDVAKRNRQKTISYRL